MQGPWARVKSVWRALTRADQLDAAMDDEMRFHIDMEAERLVRERGLDANEAQRLAHVAFGGVEKFKEAGRDTRGLRWLDLISLDARLALRMLIKYRGLTLVGGFAMAVAIAVGATAFEAFSQVLNPALPFEDGDRIVALRFATSTPGSAERRVLHDFVQLRQDLESIEQVGAFRSFELSFGTVVYTVALAVFAAVIIGVLPGIKATSGRVNANLRELDTRSGNRLGALWTTLVVAQVAVAVAVLPLAVHVTWQVVQMGAAGPEFAADRFVVGVVAAGDEVSAADLPRVGQRQFELLSHLQAEPGVTAVTFSSGVPGFAPGRLLRFEDSSSSRAGEEQRVKYPGTDLGVDALDVSLNLFDTYDAELLAGRPFASADLGAANGVIVNNAFVREFLSASTTPAGALGFRYVAPYERRGTPADTSYQIIGVVDDFPRFPREPGSDGDPTIYHPVAAGDVHPVVLSVRFGGSVPVGFIDRFRAICAEVDPALQLRRVLPLAEYYYQLRSFWRYLAWGIGLVTVSVLLLSAAGMYALMSFTVAQRTREVAIRAALGAAPRRLLFTIFGRATRQLALGLLLGSLLAFALFNSVEVDLGRAATIVLIVSMMMVAVGLLAASGPARRGLRIEPSDALRADG